MTWYHDSPLFTGIDEHAIENIMMAARPYRFKQGSIIFAEHTPATRVYLIKEGWIRLYKLSAHGRQNVIRIATSPEVIGISAILPNTQYTLSAQTVTPSMMLGWNSIDIQDLVKKYPQLQQNCLHMLTNLRDDLQQQVLYLATERIEVRLAHILLRVARQQHPGVGFDQKVTIQILQRDLADMIGVNHYTISRLIHRWQQQGIIQTQPHHTFLVDLNAVKTILGED